MDVWLRGTLNAETRHIDALPAAAHEWNEGDVRLLLSEMLLALEREKNPQGPAPEVVLRGFSWIVSPYRQDGVLVHLEMQLGTVSAGPIAIDADRLTGMIEEVMRSSSSERVH